ncbi:MAG: coiled-coil domain-containing protein [Cellulosilyticaceae bacterium]
MRSILDQTILSAIADREQVISKGRIDSIIKTTDQIRGMSNLERYFVFDIQFGQALQGIISFVPFTKREVRDIRLLHQEFREYLNGERLKDRLPMFLDLLNGNRQYIDTYIRLFSLLDFMYGTIQDEHAIEQFKAHYSSGNFPTSISCNTNFNELIEKGDHEVAKRLLNKLIIKLSKVDKCQGEIQIKTSNDMMARACKQIFVKLIKEGRFEVTTHIINFNVVQYLSKEQLKNINSIWSGSRLLGDTAYTMDDIKKLIKVHEVDTRDYTQIDKRIGQTTAREIFKEIYSLTQFYQDEKMLEQWICHGERTLRSFIQITKNFYWDMEREDLKKFLEEIVRIDCSLDTYDMYLLDYQTIEGIEHLFERSVIASINSHREMSRSHLFSEAYQNFLVCLPIELNTKRVKESLEEEILAWKDVHEDPEKELLKQQVNRLTTEKNQLQKNHDKQVAQKVEIERKQIDKDYSNLLREKQEESDKLGKELEYLRAKLQNARQELMEFKSQENIEDIQQAEYVPLDDKTIVVVGNKESMRSIKRLKEAFKDCHFIDGTDTTMKVNRTLTKTTPVDMVFLQYEKVPHTVSRYINDFRIRKVPVRVLQGTNPERWLDEIQNYFKEA